jgi:hypothetical protein
MRMRILDVGLQLLAQRTGLTRKKSNRIQKLSLWILRTNFTCCRSVVGCAQRQQMSGNVSVS